MSAPPVRPDGRCTTCLGPRGTIPKTLLKRTARTLAVQLANDPFCSTECARAWYGTTLPVLVGNRSGSTPQPIRHGTEAGYKQGCRDRCCLQAATAKRRARRQQNAAA